MATAITGTVAWTCDTSQASGWTDGTARSSFFWGRGKPSPNEAYYYAHCRNTTGILARLNLSTHKCDVLYTGTGLTSANTNRHVLVSADGLTLYVLDPNGSTVTVYAVAADGSTATPFVATTTFTDTPNPIGDYDPVTGGWLRGGNTNFVKSVSPISWALTAVHTPPGPLFVQCAGIDRSDPDGVFWGDDANFFSGVFRYSRGQGRSVCYAGSQAGGAGGTGSDPYAVATGKINDVTADGDGRVYYADTANRVRRIDTLGGAISDVVGNYSASSGFTLLPAANALLVGNTQAVAKVT